MSLVLRVDRALQSVVFNSNQKMALRAFYFIRTPTKALIYDYIKRSQCHIFTPIENNGLEDPISLRVANNRNPKLFVINETDFSVDGFFQFHTFASSLL